MPLMPAPEEWTYSGDPSATALDQVRFWIQDTDPAVRLMSDRELHWLITTWKPRHDSLIYVAAVAAESVAAKFAGVVTVSADGVTVNVADLAERYRILAASLRQLHKQAQVGGEIDISNLMVGHGLEANIEPLVFGMGLFDNGLAGRQNYGGDRFNPWDDAVDRAGG